MLDPPHAQHHIKGVLDHDATQQALQRVKSLKAHAGHRNLAIRACTSLGQGVVSVWLISSDVKDQLIPVAIFQFCSSMTLAFQFRTGNPLMFVLRGCCSWGICICAIHAAACGKTWPWGEDVQCVTAAWHDIREPLRVLHVLAAVRVFFNGLSLFCQFKFPTVMFLGHGNIQLFCRGCCQMSGLLIHVPRYILKRTQLDGTKFERKMQEEMAHFFRCLFIFCSALSLWHQWWNTGKGHTGNALSDAYETCRRQGLSTKDSLRSMRIHAKEMQKKASEKAAEVGHHCQEGAAEVGHQIHNQAHHAKEGATEVGHQIHILAHNAKEGAMRSSGHHVTIGKSESPTKGNGADKSEAKQEPCVENSCKDQSDHQVVQAADAADQLERSI